MPGKVNREIKGDVLASLRGADVEARVQGACYRGKLLDSTPEYLVIERATTCRRVIIARSHLAVLVDERAPDLHLRGARDAEAALDRDGS
jgi:hypothetical protein